MDAKSNTWKLQDAKARFSELVRRARAGEPQHVTLHGKNAVVVIDPERFDIRPKDQGRETLAAFVKASKKYRGSPMRLERVKMTFAPRVSPFDEE